MFRRFFNRCAIILILGFITCGYVLSRELYEGSPCTTEHGVPGECKILTDCIARFNDAMAGLRNGNAPGRCGFAKNMEIVCCATVVDVKNAGPRPADVACNNYHKEFEDIKSVQIHPFIYNGTSATEGEFPYMAALGFRNADKLAANPIIYNCGGTLISRKYVLTAAHCVRNRDNRAPVVVRLGSTVLDSGKAQEIEIANITSHEKYRISQSYYDIALVQLKTSAELSKNVKPICLQTKAPHESIKSSSWFGAIGFGATETNYRSNRLLKTASLEFIPRNTCDEDYMGSPTLPDGLGDTVICALDANRERGSDACQGDSGGPLLTISGSVHTQVAVTSFGSGCGSIIPGVYTSVYSYLNWIEPKVWPNLPKQ